jgi:hypothetical protein
VDLAAAAVGITVKGVRDCAREHPAFAEEFEAAGNFYVSLLEWEGVHMSRVRNNPRPLLARLRAEMPDRYSERQVTTLNVGPPIDAEEARALLAEMLRSLSSTTMDPLARRGFPMLPAAQEPPAE